MENYYDTGSDIDISDISYTRTTHRKRGVMNMTDKKTDVRLKKAEALIAEYEKRIEMLSNGCEINKIFGDIEAKNLHINLHRSHDKTKWYCALYKKKKRNDTGTYAPFEAWELTPYEAVMVAYEKVKQDDNNDD